MKLYDCRVRLGGNLLHDVPKVKISGKEIHLLKSIHGDDAIVGVSEKDDVQRDERDELFRLARIYGKKRVEDTFRTTLENFDEWLQDALSSEEEQRDAEEQQRRATQEAQRRTQPQSQATVAA